MLSLSVYSHLNALLSQLSPQLVKVMLDTVGRCYFLCYTHTRTFYRSLLLPKPCLTEGMCSSILQQAGKMGISFSLATDEQKEYMKRTEGGICLA